MDRFTKPKRVKVFYNSTDAMEDMKIETAQEFCERTDLEQGEAWSNDYEDLAIKMQEYAEHYHQAKPKHSRIVDGIPTRF